MVQLQYHVLLFLKVITIYMFKPIDDLKQNTIASASTLSKEVKTKNLSTEASKEVGELMGQKLTDLKITKAVFDRGGYIYHGRVKSLADGIREKGIEF